MVQRAMEIADSLRAVEVEGEIKRLRTMADGTVDLTITLPEYCLPQAGVLLGWVKEYVRVVMELKPQEEERVKKSKKSYV